MKDHHLGNTIFAVVAIAALIGLYFMYTGPGRAIQQPIVSEELGFCCCQDPDAVVKVPASLLSTDERLDVDCMNKCLDRRSNSRQVIPLGPC